MRDITNKIFSQCEQSSASDVHITQGDYMYMRVHGNLEICKSYGVFGEDQLLDVSLDIIGCTDEVGVKRRDILRSRMGDRGSIDGAVTSAAGYRYRFNIYRQSEGFAIALRRLEDSFRSLKELGVPSTVGDFCSYNDGLVLVTGPTGSGKSTTLATLIDKINRERDGHIITIEDPIEYRHTSCKSLVHQREIGKDASTFYDALVDSLRQDPDVILVGEIRELETMRTAITAAETGHLVFSTLHAGDAVGAIERFIGVFPEGEQDSIRRQLALTLRGVFAQHLLPRVNGGRVLCGELLVVNSAISNLIATSKTRQIYSMLELGKLYGMQTLERELSRLYKEGLITQDTMARFSRKLSGNDFGSVGKM